jgi:FkbM family methyltransferase
MTSRLAKRVLAKGRYELDWAESRLALREVDQPRVPLGRGERPFYLILQQRVSSPGAVVYDIGAGTGTFAVAAASSRRVGEVFAFEPHQRSYRKLADRVERFGNVTVFNTALGDRNGSGTLFESELADSSSLLPMADLHVTSFPRSRPRGQSPASIRRLDDVVADERLPRPDFIKMDVQGYEDRVLAGGKETFAAAQHCLVELNLAELYEGSAQFEDVYRILFELDFSLVGVGRSVISSQGTTLQFDGLFARGDG